MNKSVLIIGTGYIGLAEGLSLAYSNKFNKDKLDVYCYDIDEERINELNNNYDKNIIFEKEEMEKVTNIYYISSLKDILLEKNNNFDYIIITIPITADETTFNISDYNLRETTRLICSFNLKNTVIIYESTVYPGLINSMIDLIKTKIDLCIDKDFYVGYSPERLNPRSNTKIEDAYKEFNSKLVAGTSKISKEKIGELYKRLNINIIYTKSIQEAELTKIIENSQKDVGIALIHEIRNLCLSLKINVHNIINYASTKESYHSYHPGLVGGSCIPLSSLLLSYCGKKYDIDMDITNIGRQKNRNQFKNTSQKIANVILKEQLRIKEINICFLGFSYKANVGIFKNSQIGYVINDLYYNFDLKKISIYDSYFTDKNIKSVDNIIKKDLNCPDIEIFTDINKLKQYDIVCLSINHDNLIINEKLLSKIIKPNGIYIDFYNRKIDNIPDNINYYPSSYPSNYLSWYNIDEI